MSPIQPNADFFRDLERTRCRALVDADMTVVQRLHAPGYMLVSPSGRTFTRERYLSMLASGVLKYIRWEHGEIDVRVSEGMALVRYRATLALQPEEGGASTPFQCWHTDSYELSSGHWQAVWSQATKIT